jgi:two-component system cell cycle sensor histidine kinase/response regulator CckA
VYFTRPALVVHMSENTRTILLVDDERMPRQVLGELLTLHGHYVLDAEDYYTALQAAESHDGRIDILITDISLPGLNGCELARKLLQYRPALKVLFMSGCTGAEICPYYGIDVGDLHFLSKPFTQAEFIHRLQVLAAAAEPYPASLSPMPKTFSTGG